ncbi:hypothetical protein OG2516_14096 [Oceanicola granulosus HTCC2516]|uniref:Cupin type-2 domain-containing protein n=1 Tax=Oceanicola granulosus (strain ATCC BAA-861 / DSM 15982 / KCTC 12143 / HTCC2516) TaxID=314256 RepID=Q2CAT5_OCEGH|nr:cupin domain-containing protein [Oceanicola granulosus]EAR49796.1 hypothetical protein OG2516_14096 [Oceanicola granulosus HTCC2516]
MILRRGSVPAERRRGSAGWRTEVRLSEAGGLTQYGAYVVTLEARTPSSERHWHLNEDEFLYLLEGRAVVVENDGEHEIGPGDAVCWPAGVANAHAIRNDTDAPVTFLVVGTRAERDVVTYPDSGRVLRLEPPRAWGSRDPGAGESG